MRSGGKKVANQAYYYQLLNYKEVHLCQNYRCLPYQSKFKMKGGM